MWARVLALVTALSVPLGLALASQTLAARPGRPPVPQTEVRLTGTGPEPTNPTTSPTPMGTPSGPATEPDPSPSSTSSPSTTTGPRVVRPLTDLDRDEAEELEGTEDD